MVDYLAARKAMVDGQIRPSDVTLYPIIKALLTVPREVYVPREQRTVAYMDQDIDLGNGRSILAPRTFARMLDVINIQPDELVLAVGSELGYSTAVIAELSEVVIGVEDVTMAEQASTRLSEEGVDNAVIHTGPLAAGAAEHGPYDSMVILGGIEFIPDSLLEQLKPGGKVVAIRVSDERQQISIGIKTSVRMNWNAVYNASAPLLAGFETAKEFTF